MCFVYRCTCGVSACASKQRHSNYIATPEQRQRELERIMVSLHPPPSDLRGGGGVRVVGEHTEAFSEQRQGSPWLLTRTRGEVNK